MTPSSYRLPLGTFVGARSGDKGGNANVGVWVVDPAESAAVTLAQGGTASREASPESIALADARFEWLLTVITPEGVRHLLPESAPLAVDIHPLPNLRAINVVVHGILDRGVAETSRVDPQAKGLGEHLRARLVDIPAHLLDEQPGSEGRG